MSYRDLYNAERYIDCTAFIAIRNADRDLRNRSKYSWVYICSPYAGDIKKNVENARKYCKYAVKEGYMPVASHLLFTQFLDDSKGYERELGLEFGLELLRKSSEVWVFGDYISEGMHKEIKKARELGIPIVKKNLWR